MAIHDRLNNLMGQSKSIDYDTYKESLIGLLTENVEDTVTFLNEGCTSEQLTLISEFLDEVISITRSHDIIDALYKAAERCPYPSQKRHIIAAIETSEDYIPESSN